MRLARTQLILAVILLAVVVIGDVILTHNVLTAPYPGHNDFMSRWEGARSYWIDGLDPYGEQASLNIQNRIYGRAAQPGEDPGFFAYPFYTVFVVAPLVTIDYAWASAIWMVLLEVCLIAALFLISNLLNWRPHPLLLGGLLLWGIFDYFAMRGLLLGQPGILVYALEILTIWALFRKRDGLAGIALALSTLKPQMGFLFIPLILLFALFDRRWRLLIGFGVSMIILFGLSFLLVPAWLGEWIVQIGNYTSYTAIGSPVWVIMQYYLRLGSLGEYIVIAVLIAYMLWAWYELILRRQHDRLLWTITLTLTVTHLVAVRTATTHFVVFVLPILFYIRLLDKPHSWGLALLIPIAITAFTWVHFVTTVRGEFEDPAIYLPLPFTMLVLLIMLRLRWWAWRPNRA